MPTPIQAIRDKKKKVKKIAGNPKIFLPGKKKRDYSLIL